MLKGQIKIDHALGLSETNDTETRFPETTMELHHSKLLRSMKEMISLRLWPSQLHRLGTLRPHAHHKSLWLQQKRSRLNRCDCGWKQMSCQHSHSKQNASSSKQAASQINAPHPPLAPLLRSWPESLKGMDSTWNVARSLCTWRLTETSRRDGIVEVTNVYIYIWSRIMRHSIHHNRGHSRKRHLSAWANYEINFDKEFRFDLDLHCPSLFQIKAGLEKMCPNTFEFCVSACHCVQLTCCNLEMLAPNFFGAQMNLWFDHESNWSSPSNGTLAACQRSHALKFAQPSPEQKLSKFASWVRCVACEMPLFETQTSCIAVAALPKSPNKVHCRSRTSLSQIKQQLAASFTVCNQNHHSSLCTLAMFLHKSQFVGQQLGSSAEKQSNVAVFLSHYVLKLSPSKQFLR